MAQLDKTFPTNDCSMCILAPKMIDCASNPEITLWTCSEMVELVGGAGNFKAKVKRNPRYINEELCVGCMDCVEGCIYKKPKFANEFDMGLAKRKPIYRPFPQAVPSVALVDPKTCIELKTGNCKKTCIEACDRNAIDLEQKEEIVTF